MKGGIYSNEKCPVCGGGFRDFGNALICPIHPKCRASRFKVKFGKVIKRFKNYGEAFRFLTGVRYETDRQTFDERDYRRDNPLSFTNASERYFTMESDDVRSIYKQSAEVMNIDTRLTPIDDG